MISRLVTGTLAFLLALPPAFAGSPSEEGVILQSEDLEWQDAIGLPEGAKMAILHGDPMAEGPFVVRFSLPADFKIAPHSHPSHEKGTILKGSAHFGFGETYDLSKAELLGPEDFIIAPPGENHYVHTMEPTIIEVHAEGPWGITYVNPDDDPRQ